MQTNLNYADRTLACCLGVASVGIGLTELLAPDIVQHWLGLEPCDRNRGVLRVLGLREVAHGASILADGSKANIAAGVWSRVAGDVLDNALLVNAATKSRNIASFSAVAASVMVIGALDVYAGVRLARGPANTNGHAETWIEKVRNLM
ncbi:MAG: hypothetical protein U0805_11785 [Pirellulales bacterium]